MFKLIWDKKNNGVLLVKSDFGQNVIPPPRPVFYEELNTLRFDKYWKYPNSKSPLLWAIGRRYYYKGTFVAEAKGGNIFDPPEIIITKEGKNLNLKPIDIKKIIKLNKDKLNTLTNEALDFISNKYNKYREKIKYFTVAFSGGKDSQVVLDLVTRIIPSDELLVIFADTTMELPYTYETFEKTKELYQKRYPNLKFIVSKPPKNALELWKEFGPPSRIQRWCCTVTKTAPFLKKIREITGTNKPIVVFEGVRAEESEKRSNYSRVTTNVKGMLQTNLEVILKWNLTEVFLYLFSRDIFINRGYRNGFHRVGCSVCPFASNWTEFLLNTKFPLIVKRYTDLIYQSNKILSGKELKKYIKEGQWKKRAGGRELKIADAKGIDILYKDDKLQAVLTNPEEDFFEWLKVLGKTVYDKSKGLGEVNYNGATYNFSVKIRGEKKIIHFSKPTTSDFKRRLEKIFYKTTYCVHCGACESECPTGAIEFSPKLSINSNLCIFCYNCLDFSEKGCLLAKSINISKGGGMKKDRIVTSRYQTFGLRGEWINDFFETGEEWFMQNSLGNRQREAFIVWLKDSSVLDNKKSITSIGKELMEFYKKGKKLVVWQFLTVNLYYGSKLFKWYFDSFSWGITISRNELIEEIKNTDDNVSPKTAANSISSLLNLFEASPIGNELRLGIIKKEKNQRFVHKIGAEHIDPYVIAYSLYYLKDLLNRKSFTVGELYSEEFKGGPYQIFGISKEKLIRALKGLMEDGFLSVDIKADLDNIRLKEDFKKEEILKRV